MIKHFSDLSFGAALRNPMAPRLETPWRRASKPLRRPSKPHGAAPRNPRCAAPRNPMAPRLETPAPPLETPWRRASKPQVRRASKPLGTNFETKIFKFRWFLGPSDQNELYHTPLLSKI